MMKVYGSLWFISLKSQDGAKGFEKPSFFWKAMEKEKPNLFCWILCFPEEDGITILKKLGVRPDRQNCL